MQKKFEYNCVYRVKKENNDLVAMAKHVEILNDLGKEGWELVQIIENKFSEEPALVYFFKREIV